MANPQPSEQRPDVGGSKRRRHGDGSVRPTKSGTFEVRWRERDPETGKSRRRSRNVATSAEADQLLAEIAMANRADDGLDELYAIVTGRAEEAVEVDDAVVAPGAVFDWSSHRSRHGQRVDFLFLVQVFVRDRHRKGRAPTTMAQYRDLWKRVYRDIGAQHPDDLSVHGADEYLVWLGRRGETDSTVNAIRGFLSSVCSFAMAKEYCERNPFAGSDRNRESTPDPKAPTDAQARALYRAAQETGMTEAVMVRLAMMTGSRRGEIAAFRWSDVDWVHSNIRRHRGASTASGFDGVQIGQTKTHRDDMIPLDEVTLGLLLLHHESCAQLAESLGVVRHDDAFLLSPEPDGSRPFRPDALSRRFTSVAQLVPGAEWVRLKHLRKWTATTTRDLDPEAAMRRLSHEQLSTTERHYFAADAERDAAVTRFLASRLSDSDELR